MCKIQSEGDSAQVLHRWYTEEASEQRQTGYRVCGQNSANGDPESEGLFIVERQ